MDQRTRYQIAQTLLKAADVLASTNRECMLVELEPGRWFGFLGDDSVNQLESDEEYERWSSSHDTEWVAVEGPASTEDAAYKLVADRHGNPGGSSSLPFSSMDEKTRSHWLKEAHSIKPGIKLPKPKKPASPDSGLKLEPLTPEVLGAAGMTGVSLMTGVSFPEGTLGLTTKIGDTTYAYIFKPESAQVFKWTTYSGPLARRPERTKYVFKGAKDAAAALKAVKNDLKVSREGGTRTFHEVPKLRSW